MTEEPKETDSSDDGGGEPTQRNDGGTNLRKRRSIDKDKILALKKAGWKVKDIAEDMGLEAATVSQVLWRENQKRIAENV